MLRAYKTELDPNNVQRTLFLQHAGAARWAYNWGLCRKQEEYTKTGKSPSAIDLHRELNILKQKPVDEGGVPWMYESSKCAPQEALRNLDSAFAAFFRRCKAGAKKKGFPKFKSRKKGIGTFSLTGSVRVTDHHVQLPRIGNVRLKERGYLPTQNVKVLKSTVSEKAGRWFVSLQVEEKIMITPAPNHVVGVDVGIKRLAVTSDGQVFSNPKALRQAQANLRRSQQSISRKQKGSRNRCRAVQRLARRHYRVVCIRRNATHQLTSAITKSAAVIVIESLNVAGMVKSHCLASAVNDATMAEIHRQLDYKAKWRGGTILKADRWFPSSKTCSDCGFLISNLPLSVREWVCPDCGMIHDRDVNAARNLKKLAGSSPVAACGELSSGASLVTRTKLGSTKQEPDTGESRAG